MNPDTSLICIVHPMTFIYDLNPEYRGGGYLANFLGIVKTHVRYWISRLYLAGISAAELRWYLSIMKVIKKKYNRYFCKIENFAYGEINERTFSNPHPRTVKYRV